MLDSLTPPKPAGQPEPEKQPAKPKRRFWWRLWRSLWVTFFCVVIGLLGLVLGMNVTYADTVLPNTSVGGTAVGGLTKEAALRLVENTMINRQELKIIVGDETLTAEAIDLGISFDVAEAVDQAYMRGKSGNLLEQMTALVTSVALNKSFSIKPNIDQESLNAYVNEQVAGKITEPKDATLAVEGSKIVVKADVPGTAINLEKIKHDLTEAVSSNSPLVVTAEIKQIRAEITKEQLAVYQEKIQQLAGAQVSITVEDKTLKPTFAQKVGWYKLDKDAKGQLRLVIDDQAVSTIVAQLAKQVDVTMVKEQVNTTNAVVAAGRDGKKLDQTATKAELTKILNNSLQSGQALGAVTIALPATFAIIPKEVVVLTPESAGIVAAIDTEAKFIQVNLGQQKMYLFENRQLVNTFTISSGKAGMETPRGVHSIVNKALRPYSKIYGLYMPYWNAISGDGKYGIHELPEWPGGYKEGESHLGRPVSHGCIRLGVGAAKYVYEWAPLGTAVVVQ